MNDQLQTALDQQKISQATFDNIQAWLNNPQAEEFHQEIDDLIAKEDWGALSDAFFTLAEFGSAGIRGRTGVGSTRINNWTVGTAIQGLADYIHSLGKEARERGVVLGSDTRLTSPQFIKLASDILTSNGIRVFKFARPAQVGMFSFAIRLYKAQAGVYISASHNPPTDNGVKVYWEDGAQILPPHDKGITDAIRQVTEVTKGKGKNEQIENIDDEFDTLYRTRVLRESVSNSRSAKVVYSPFHGTGQYGVLPILQAAGFEVTTVEEQMKPDGHFPNVPGGVPNPQNRESNALTAQKALEIGADLGISTDPDADRLGVVIPKDGGTVILDGNETLSLLTYFVLTQLKENDKLPANGFVVKTLVTTGLVDAIAADFDVKSYNDVPVGFKFIGEIIKKHEDFGDEIFIIGGEESFGSLKGSYARDKDASVPSLLAAEMVSWLKDQGKTVWDLQDEMRAKYGYYLNDLQDLVYEGAEGFTKMAKLMENIRNNPPKQIGEWTVSSIIDRKTNEIKSADGTVTGKVEGHTANVVVFNLSEDGKNQVVVRPSGTEPKVKLYIAMHDASGNIEETKAKAAQLKIVLKELAENLTK